MSKEGNSLNSYIAIGLNNMVRDVIADKIENISLELYGDYETPQKETKKKQKKKEAELTATEENLRVWQSRREQYEIYIVFSIPKRTRPFIKLI